MAIITGPAGHGHRHSPTRARASAIAATDIAAAAGYLGVAPAALRAKLRQGETLATIAQRSGGHSVGGLAAALAADKAARLRAARKEGRLSETAAQAQLSTVTARHRRRSVAHARSPASEARSRPRRTT